MRFEYAAALAALLLVIAPFAAHLLRLRRPQQRAFAPAALVPAAPPAARSRSRLEDRALLALRAVAVLALVLLGATPFVRCSRLSMGRSSGASVALVLVIDDSSSMQARTPSGRSKFEVARSGALDLVAGVREGDSVGVVLAGDPVRVALVPTSDPAVMSSALRELQVSDRATDLEGALAIAQGMARALPQGDRRIVVLSDLADGKSDGPALGEGLEVALWVPRDGLDEASANCAVVRADRNDHRVVAHVACSGAQAGHGRQVQVLSQGKIVAQRPVGTMGDERPASMDVTVDLPDGAPEPDEVALTGPPDAIEHDDRAPAAPPMRGAVVAVISDAASSRVATGGPPPVEQALAALGSMVTIRPLPAVPETLEEMAPYAGLVLDDPPGLTPEAREAVRKWLEAGGVALAALGPRAASAPLGASLDPFIAGNVRWETKAPDGVDAKTASVLGPSAESLAALRPTGRLVVDAHGTNGEDVLVRWADGAPWLMKKAIGRGTAMTLTMSMAPDQSDLVVRPGFLALLASVAEAAASRGGTRRIEVGGSWSFPKQSNIEVGSTSSAIEVREVQDRKRVTPRLAGRYDLRVDGVAEVRFATIPEREIDLRARKVVESATAPTAGSTTAWVDLSRYMALVLLGLLAGEMVVRFLMAWKLSRTPAS